MQDEFLHFFMNSMGNAMIEGLNELAKKYELSEADIERVLGAPTEMPPTALANGARLSGRSISAHKGHVFGACRSVRSSITLGAGARFMRATYKLALMNMIAEAKSLGANAIININVSTSQGDSYYVSITGDAVLAE
jgi:uncharacterized protein YbjQ (UPF0145 family)